MLNTDRQAHGGAADAGFDHFRIGQLAVRGRCRVRRQAARVANIDQTQHQLQRVEEARVAASLWSSGVDLIQGNFVQQAGGDMSYDFHASSA